MTHRESSSRKSSKRGCHFLPPINQFIANGTYVYCNLSGYALHTSVIMIRYCLASSQKNRKAVYPVKKCVVIPLEGAEVAYICFLIGSVNSTLATKNWKNQRDHDIQPVVKWHSLEKR